MANWRLAPALITLRNQVDSLHPGRSKASDGTIGDPAHQAKTSDHNPDRRGVVAAIDLTHDPKHGLDIQKLADALVASKDTRIKYIIANRRIWENGVWKDYIGTNPHNKHLHLSVNAVNYDDAREWKLKEGDKVNFTEEQIRNLADAAEIKQTPEQLREGAKKPAFEVAMNFIRTIHKTAGDFHSELEQCRKGAGSNPKAEALLKAVREAVKE